MEEKEIIIGDNIFKKTVGKVLKITFIVTVVLAIISFISCNIRDNYFEERMKIFKEQLKVGWSSEEYKQSEEKYKKLDNKCDFWWDTYQNTMYCAIGTGAITIVLLIFKFYASKMKIVVTNKRVYGVARFGKRVDLPIDLISAVGSCMFKGIIVSSSSGKIRFLLINNRDEIHKTISNLLITRQDKKQVVNNTSTTDELMKYKELLDSGVITQEEFDAKKKQLLNL